MRDPKLAIYDDIFPKSIGDKARATHVAIIEAALRSYAKYGVDNTTYEKLASETAVSRPLIIRYFKNYDAIFSASVKFVRIHYQRWVIEEIQRKNTPLEQFNAYVERSMSWPKRFPTHAQLWAFFYYQCARQKKYRNLNSQLSNMGERRIAALLAAIDGASDLGPYLEKAKIVQMTLAGTILALYTENLGPRTRLVQKNMSEILLKLKA